MGQTSKILEGWKSYLKGGASGEEKKRAIICEGCPEAVLGTYEQFMPDNTLKEVRGLKCNSCGCPLSTKLRVKNESCPLDKW